MNQRSARAKSLVKISEVVDDNRSRPQCKKSSSSFERDSAQAKSKKNGLRRDRQHEANETD